MKIFNNSNLVIFTVKTLLENDWYFLSDVNELINDR